MYKECLEMQRKAVNLPLHGGKCPSWLFGNMKELAEPITKTIVQENSREDLIKKLSDPLWFQSLSCVLGYDWHSSGVTTVTTAVLREAIDPEELGIVVCGGKGKTSRKTPQQIIDNSELLGVKPSHAELLQSRSKLSAKVDSNCLQDQHSLYHHSFVFTEEGDWCVIQQGKNEGETGEWARRYHWYSTEEMIEEPHSGISSQDFVETMDLTSRDSEGVREISLDLVKDGENIEKYFRPKGQTTLTDLPAHHDVKITKPIKKALEKAEEIQPRDYEELVELKGVGQKTLRALALVSDLVYNEKPSFDDPATYSFAHGGKDGHPYPVDEKTYEKTISTLKETVEQSEIGNKDKEKALKKLSNFINED